MRLGQPGSAEQLEGVCTQEEGAQLASPIVLALCPQLVSSDRHKRWDMHVCAARGINAHAGLCLIRSQIILVLFGGVEPIVFKPFDGVCGRFNLVVLLRLPHLKCLFVCLHIVCSNVSNMPCVHQALHQSCTCEVNFLVGQLNKPALALLNDPPFQYRIQQGIQLFLNVLNEEGLAKAQAILQVVPEHLVIELGDPQLIGFFTVHQPQAALALWINEHGVPAGQMTFLRRWGPRTSCKTRLITVVAKSVDVMSVDSHAPWNMEGCKAL